MVKKDKVVAFIVARLSSSRLPRKHLKLIGDKRMIDWTIDFTKQVDLIDEIVIATTNREEDKELAEVAKGHGINVFLYEGGVNDVVGRLTKAALEFEAEIPVLVSGDCPLIWPDAVRKRIEKITEDPELDFVGFCKKNDRYPIHSSVGVFRKKAWILADKISDKPNLREHHFPIINLRRNLFKIDCVSCDDIFYKVNHRISVDTLADLKFMNAVYDELKKDNKPFDLKNVVELLLKKPELMNINRDVHQMGIWEKQKKALFRVKDRENIAILLKLAYELTKMGVGVEFCTEDDKIRELIESKGFRLNKDPSNDFHFLIAD